MAILGLLSAVFSAAGSIQAGDAAKKAGADAQREKEFEAKQFAQNANTELASAERASDYENKRTQLVASRALAVSSASGGGAADPTVTHIIGDINAEGVYRASAALYQGEESARRMRMGESVSIFEGNQAMQAGKDQQSAYNWKAAGSIIDGVSGMYSKYNTPSPKKNDTTNVGAAGSGLVAGAAASYR